MRFFGKENLFLKKAIDKFVLECYNSCVMSNGVHSNKEFLSLFE